MQAVFRSIVLCCAASGLVACTLITGSTAFHTKSTNIDEDDDSGSDDTPPDRPPPPSSDAAVEIPDSTVPGAFCSTQAGFNSCLDFEQGQPLLDSLSKEISNGALTLEKADTNVIVSKSNDGVQGYAYLRAMAGTSTTHFEWAFDARLDEATAGHIEFAGIFFDYNSTGECGLNPTVEGGQLQVTEFCEGDGLTTTTIPTTIGAVQAGAGWHRWSIVFDTAARTYQASVKRPDGTLVQTTVITMEQQLLNSAAPEIDLGVLFIPTATSPGMKVRLDNFTLKFH